MLQTEGDVPLVVNLDGTLLKSDSFLETLFHLLATDARAVAKVPRWLISGRACLKHELASCSDVTPELLPYEEVVVAYLRNKHANGRRLVLVSGASQKFVDHIARFLGIFAEAYGSSRELNLAGPVRAEFLVKRYGEGRFDYLGDTSTDWPAWSKARRVVTANAPEPLRRRIDTDFPGAEHIAPTPGHLKQRLGSYMAALRPDQWVKNLLIFVPVVADHNFSSPTLLSAAIAFAAFCLTASSVYIVNDLVDIQHDRKHPWKHERPFASARVPVLHGVVMTFALLAAAVAMSAAFLDMPFLATLAVYYVLTLLYSLRLKRMLIVDMMALAGLYTIRVIAGSAATGIPPSEWLLALSMFIFLSLAAVKRQSELMGLAKHERSRVPGRRYNVRDLPMIRNFGTSSGYIAVLVLALYISNKDVSVHYDRPLLLWATCPLLLYWISRMLLKAHRGLIDRDPIVFAFRDRASWLTAALIAGFVVAASMSWP